MTDTTGPIRPKAALLEVQGLVKTFPGVRALDGVNFGLRPGEIHALVGENGAGKSTLIHVLAGVLQPDAGRVLLDGSAVRPANPSAAAAHGIGVVFQERSLCPNLSVAENLFANRQPLRSGAAWLGLIDRRALTRRTRELLAELDLDLDPERLVRELPPSVQQLLEVLKALATRPRILILDEPTACLSAPDTELLFGRLRRLRDEGAAAIYISHHLAEVFEIADRVTVLRDGRHVYTGETRATREAELVTRMVGRELHDLYGGRGHELGAEAVRVEGATRRPSFADVSFNVRQGEIVGLAGLAGAGRTELARGLFGAEPLDSGRIWLDGVPVRLRSPAEAIAHHLAYLTEDRKEEGLFLGLDVRANCVAASLRRFTGPSGLIDDRAVTDFAAGCVDDLRIMTPGLAQTLMNLSGGNQQKVLLALWLATQPRFLIVDEPTRGVDVGARSELYHRLRGLAAQGVAILLVASDLLEMLGLSDRILVMRAGRLVGEFDRAEASEERIVSCAAGVREEKGSGAFSGEGS